MGVEMQIASAVLGLAAARQQKGVYEMEAQSYKEQADMAKIQAGQQETERNRKLRMQIASLGTSSSARGVTIGTSGSTGALIRDEKDMAKADINSIRLMGSSARRKFGISAAGSQAAGKASTLGALSKAGTAAYSIHKGIT